MKKSLSFLLLGLFCSLSFQAQSQAIDISYENPLGVEIFGGQEIFRISIHNYTENIIDANSIIRVNLPAGINYASNSVSGNFIVSTSVDLNNPEFIAVDTIVAGGSVVLEFSAEAMCNSYEFINDCSLSVENQIGYSYSVGGVNYPQININDTDNYNLSFRYIDLELPSEILNESNQTLEFNNLNELLTQELNISIPGNSIDFSTFQIDLTPTDELNFVGISELIVGGTNYSVTGVTISNPTATSSTLNLLFNAADIDASITSFSANMVIKVKLDFIAKSCFEGMSQHVEYEAFMSGLNGGGCIISKSIGDFEFRSLAPSLSYSFDSDNGLNLCGNTSKVTYIMSNAVNALGPAYDVHLFLKHQNGGQIENIKINDIPVDSSIYATSVGSNVHLFGNNIPGLTDLTDEDGDGEIDDLAPGASIRVSCDVGLSLLSEDFSLDNCESGLYGLYFHSEFNTLDSQCATNYSTDDNLQSFFQLRDVGASESIVLDADFDDGQEHTVHLKLNRFGGGMQNQLYEDNMFLEARIEIPCGADFVLGSGKFIRTDNNLELGTTITTSDLGDKTILNIKLLEPYIFPNSIVNYGGIFEFNLFLNCDNFTGCTDEETLLKSTFYGSFSECPDKIINLGCVEKELFLHCYPLLPSCPNEYPIVPSSFDAIRTSYGTYNDGTQITIEGVNNGDFQDLNIDGAYACDTIQTEIVGAAVCEIQSNETFYGYVWYSHPENISFLTMTHAECSVGSGTSITVNDFEIRADLSSSNKTVYEIKVIGQQVNKYDIVKIKGFFAVDKLINNNPNFPNVYKFEEFRGGFSITPSLPVSPFHYGTEFEVYGLNYVGNSASTPASCSNDGLYSFSFNVTGGSGDDFPNEFRNVVQVVGPVEITIPQEAIGKVVPYAAHYTVTNYVGSALSIEDVGGGLYRVYDTVYGSLEEFKPFDKTSSFTQCVIYIDSVLTDCDFQETQTIDVIASHYEQNYANDSCKELVDHTYTQQIISSGSGFNVGDLKLDVVNPFFQTVGTVTTYKVDINNLSSQEAKYSWIKFTYPDDLITINNSTIDGYDVVGEIYDTNTLLLKLQPISAGSEMEGHIDVTLNDCNFVEQLVDIQIETGISCQPISDDIFNNDGIVCPLDTDKILQLEIIKSNLRMDIIPLFDNIDPLQYCDSFQYIVQIFNNEKASITSPSFQIDIPTGFDMSVQYRYPVSEVIDPTNPYFNNIGFSSPIDIISGQLWGLEETNGVLPGYITNQSGYLNNYYQLLVTLTPTCGYDGVSSINFKANGITNCNEDKEITFQTTPSFFELEEVNSYSHQLSIDVQENDDYGSYTATVHYDSDISNLSGGLSINLPPGIYSSDDLSFTLPSSGNIDFIFDFTTDPGYCQDVSFFINTIIDIDLGCDTNSLCSSSFELEDRLIETICIQECDIDAKFEVQKISDCTYQFINYSLANNWDNVQYLWDFGDGNTSTEFEPTHTYIINGNNNVSLTVTALSPIGESCESNFGPIKIIANKCSQDGSCIGIIDTTVLDLYPNPSNGRFTLSFNDCIKFCEVSVFDVLGKVIHKKIMTNDNQVFIDISNCAKGAYLIRASSDTMSLTKRVIIE